MKYRVYLREVMEPYSQKEWHEDYNCPGKAQLRIEKVNSDSYSPDWYIQAKEHIDELQDS